MLRGGRQDVLPPNHVGDPEVDVVDRARQVIGGGPVGSEDHEIVHLDVVETHLATNDVGEPGLTRSRHRETNRCVLARREAPDRLGGLHPETAVVGRGPTVLLRLGTELVQLLGRREAVIRLALGEKPLHDLAVPVETFALPIRLVGTAEGDALIPVETQPPQPVDDVIRELGGAAGTVGVVAAQHERSPTGPGEQPVVQRRPGPTDVKETRRRRREPHPRRVGWRHRHRATTGFTSTPIPSISTSTLSPAVIGPTPLGVPVRITSPGSNVMMRGHIRHDLADPEHEIAGGARLAQLPVDPARDRQTLRGVELGVDRRPERTERVEPLRPRPLPVPPLEVTGRHVVGGGVAEHVGADVLDVDVTGHPADDHRQLRFVMRLLGIRR